MIKNKHIDFIDGYLAGLSDIDGVENREFINRVFLINSGTLNIEKSIEHFFDHMKKVTTIKRETYSSICGVDNFIENMLLVNPFGVLTEVNKKIFSEDTLINYRKYVTSHLSDYIDFAFESEGIDFLSKGEIHFALMQNAKKYFIVLVIRKKDVSIFFVFFRKNYSKKQFETWYKELVQNYQLKTQEIRDREKVRNSIKDDEVLKNGLTYKINKEIIEPVIKRAIEMGYLDEMSKNTLLQYFPITKVSEIEKVLLDTEE